MKRQSLPPPPQLSYLSQGNSCYIFNGRALVPITQVKPDDFDNLDSNEPFSQLSKKNDLYASLLNLTKINAEKQQKTNNLSPGPQMNEEKGIEVQTAQESRIGRKPRRVSTITKTTAFFPGSLSKFNSPRHFGSDSPYKAIIHQMPLKKRFLSSGSLSNREKNDGGLLASNNSTSLKPPNLPSKTDFLSGDSKLQTALNLTRSNQFESSENKRPRLQQPLLSPLKQYPEAENSLYRRGLISPLRKNNKNKFPKLSEEYQLKQPTIITLYGGLGTPLPTGVVENRHIETIKVQLQADAATPDKIHSNKGPPKSKKKTLEDIPKLKNPPKPNFQRTSSETEDMLLKTKENNRHQGFKGLLNLETLLRFPNAIKYI